jgi:hypothetical protein
VVKGVPIEKVRRSFKPAEWYIRLEMPGTPEVAKRIASLADKVTLFDSGQGGQDAEFNPGRLKVDETKYPAYKSPGFTVSIDRRARKLRFTAQYPVPSLDNRAATEEGLRRWIRENLGTLTDATPITAPLAE